MKMTSVADINTHFIAYLKQCEQSPVVILDNNRPVAVLVTVSDDEEELEHLILTHTPKFRQLLESAKTRIRQTGGVEHDEFWKRVDTQDKHDDRSFS
jgi:PHD/YefM family antitoxin component YafN of YafNO toxin-antitoxin module